MPDEIEDETDGTTPPCEATDDAGYTCNLPEDHTGGHMDPFYGEWANDTSWCPSYKEGPSTADADSEEVDAPRKYFCIYKRNHPGPHLHPVVGMWLEGEGAQDHGIYRRGTCPGIEPDPSAYGKAVGSEDIAAGAPLYAVPVGRASGKATRARDQDQRWAEYQAAREEVRKAERRLKYARRKERHAWEAFRGARTFTDPDTVTKP